MLLFFNEFSEFMLKIINNNSLINNRCDLYVDNYNFCYICDNYYNFFSEFLFMFDDYNSNNLINNRSDL